MKYAKNSNIPVDERSGVKTVTCEYCKKDFEKYVKASQFPKFCSKKCSSKFNSISGKNAYASFEEMKNAGFSQEKIDNIRRKRSEGALKANRGRKLSQSTKEKISKSCTGISNRGKCQS